MVEGGVNGHAHTLDAADPALAHTTDLQPRPAVRSQVAETVADDEPDAPAGVPQIDELIARRYRIGRRLGAGGMGIVHAAFDLSTEETVAVKLLSRRATGDRVERFRRELRAARKVTHPRVVRLHDILELEDGTVALTMEYVDGEPLSDALARTPRWPADRLLRLADDLCGALAAAHAVGVVHRDLKPDNVLVRASDGAALVADFGVSRLQSASDSLFISTGSAPATIPSALTTVGALVGTPLYMAPEQLAGETAHASADIYALGLILREAATGELAHREGDSVAALLALRRVGLPPLRSVRPDLPRRLCALVDRCLQVDPAARFLDGRAVQAALHAATRQTRRSRIAVAVVLLAGLALGWRSLREHQRSSACSGGDARIAAAWDDARATQLARAFTATGRSYAIPLATLARATLDTYRRDWSAMYRDSCEQSLRSEQSPEVHELRSACLAEARLAAIATTDSFTTVGPDSLASVTDALAALPPVARCADIPALRARAAGDDPALLTATRDLRQSIAEAAARELLIPADERHAAAARLVLAATALGHPGVQADALLLRADAERGRGGYEQAALDYDAAFTAALAGRNDVAVALALVGLVKVTGYWLARHADGDAWERRAAAAVARLGPHHERVAIAHHEARASLLHEEGRHADGLAANLARLTVVESFHGPASWQAAQAHVSLAASYYVLERFADSRREFEANIPRLSAALGDEHPYTLAARHNHASLLQDSGDLAGSELAHRELLAALARLHGEDHPEWALTAGNLANTLHARRAYDESLALHQAVLAVYDRHFGPDYPDAVQPLLGIGDALVALGRGPEAVAPLERALALATRGAIRPEIVGSVRFSLGRALWPGERARALLDAATADFRGADPPRSEAVDQVAAFLAAHPD